MSGGLLFLSWVRQGLAPAAGQADPLEGPLTLRRDVIIGVRVNQRARQELTARLYGPGDVTGIDPRQVIRTDPAAGATDFEPNLLAAIELDRPDLPWMLTPAVADDRERLRPWLVLVVVEAAHARLEPAGARPLPALTCRREELPDLRNSWAWAHAQLAVDGEPTDADLDALLLGSPERTLSRLLCPRRLAPGTAYLACVVPAFEPGRKAGLGLPFEPADEQRLEAAWAPGDGELELPVYHSWPFATGPEGDFEALVRRLAPREMPATVGLRPLEISRAGPGLPELPREPGLGVLGLEGALRSPASLPTEWEPRARRSFESALAPRLTRPRARVAPPLYGSLQALDPGLPPPGGEPRWLRELNLDPRHRAAAAFGAQVVQEQQEALMASAWRQVERIQEVNALLGRGQLARMAAEGLHRRLALPADGADPAPETQERLLALTASAHAAITTGSGASVAEELEANAEARAAVSVAFRRLARPRGPVARRLTAGEPAPLASPVGALARRELTVTPTLAPAPGVATLQRLAGESVLTLRPERITQRSWELRDVGPTEGPAPAVPQITAVGAGMPNRMFTTASGRLYSCLLEGDRFGWTDHGAPPGAWAAGPPTALSDLAAFVRGGDGTLRELGWDGDRWAWHDCGAPPGTAPGGGAPVGHVRPKPPQGEIGTTGTDRGVYVVADDGRLFEWRSRGRGQGHWIDRGNPGTALAGTPGIRGPWALVLTSADGRGFDYTWNANAGRWEWRDLGRPSATGLTSAASAAMGLATTIGRIAMSQAGDAYLLVLGWQRWEQPEPVGALLGSDPDGRWWLASQGTGRLQSWLVGESNATLIEPPPGIDPTGLTLTGALRGRNAFVHAGNRLFELAGGQWRDLGPPRPAARGIRPPSRRRTAAGGPSRASWPR